MNTIDQLASRMPVVATAEHSDHDFFVFTQSGPLSDLPGNPAKVSVAAQTVMRILQKMATEKPPNE